MFDEPGLLQAIVRAPDDDGPRLLYADWLEAHGNPRGEFIRVQCALATMDDAHPDQARLAAREKALLNEHKSSWVKPLRGWFHGWGFRRGFVSKVAGALPDFLNRASDLFALAPTLVVHLSGDDRSGSLASCRYLSRVSGLDLSQLRLEEDGVRTLLASPCLTNISFLAFGDAESSLATAEAVAACPNLPRLAELCFQGELASELGDEGLRALASSPHLSRLTTLHFHNNLIRAGGAEALAASPYITRLILLCQLSRGRD